MMTQESLRITRANLATMERHGWEHVEQVAAAIAHHRLQIAERQETPMVAFAYVIRAMAQAQAFLAHIGIAYADAFDEVRPHVLTHDDADEEELTP